MEMDKTVESKQFLVLSLLGEGLLIPTTEMCKGSFGKVYLAVDKKRNIKVAIKRVPKLGSSTSREVQILQSIQHPNCITLLDTFYSSSNQVTFHNMIFPYFPQNLKQFMKTSNTRFTLDVIKRVFCQICNAVDHLHSKRIVHRDLTPSNILIDTDGSPVVGDFGSAKVLEDSHSNMSYVTSRYYRAPELFVGCSNYGVEVDIWSLGTILYEMVFGEPLFQGKDDVEHLLQIISLKQCIGRLPDYNGLNPQLEKLQSRFPYIEEISFKNIFPSSLHDLADLLSQIFCYDLEQRITSKRILEHPFLL